jgi:hypothetical protein
VERGELHDRNVEAAKFDLGVADDRGLSILRTLDLYIKVSESHLLT